MSDSNRGERNSHLARDIGFLSAVVLACLFGLGLGYLEGYQGEARQNSADEYAQAAKRNALVACSDGEPAAIADCVYDEVSSAREQSQGEQDLDAQQWMARWAMVLTFITALTTLISWIALRYLRDTFQQTAKGANAAADATKAMIDANDISLSIAKSDRAWLVPTEVITHFYANSRIDGKPVSDGIGFAVKFSNGGRSPALFVDTAFEYAIVPRGVPTENVPIEPPTPDKSSSAIVGPGRPVETSPLILDDAQTRSFRDRTTKIILVASAHYHDIFAPEGAPEFQRVTNVFYVIEHRGGSMQQPDGTMREAISFNMAKGSTAN